MTGTIAMKQYVPLLCIASIFVSISTRSVSGLCSEKLNS